MPRIFFVRLRLWVQLIGPYGFLPGWICVAVPLLQAVPSVPPGPPLRQHHPLLVLSLLTVRTGSPCHVPVWSPANTRLLRRSACSVLRPLPATLLCPPVGVARPPGGQWLCSLSCWSRSAPTPLSRGQCCSSLFGPDENVFGGRGGGSLLAP